MKPAIAAESPSPLGAEDSRPLEAAAWMAGAMASFSMMAIAGRELATDANPFQILFWRSVVGFLIVAGFVAVSDRGAALIRTRRGGLHVLRNISHFFGQSCWFFAIGLIPLAQVFAFEFTTPIWVALLAPLVLGERFTLARALAAALGFIGVMAIIRPDGFGLGLGQAVAMAAAIGFAGSIMSTKSLSRTDATPTILFWMTACQMAMALASDAVYSGLDGFLIREPAVALWMAVVGVCGLSAHLCITSALKCAPATLVGPIDFFRLPLIAVLGMALYDEPLDLMAFVGGALVFVGNFINLVAERRKSG